MSQKKAKFNIVDIIVILVLIAGIAFVGVRMFGGQDSAADPDDRETYHVTFYAECVPEAVASSLRAGSKVGNTTIPEGKTVSNAQITDLGELIDFTIGESVVYTADSKGKIVQSSKPGYVSVTLTCELSGIEQPTGLLVDRYMLNVGHAMEVSCGLTMIDAIVLGIAAA